MGIKLKIKKGETEIIEDDSTLGKLISGAQGRVFLKTPFGKRELKIKKKG